MKRLVCLMWLLVLVMSSHAQIFGQIEKLQDLTIECGDLRELRGQRVFVHSDNLAARPCILREMAKYPRLKVVGRKEDADFVLLFGSNLIEQGAPYGSDAFSSVTAINSDSVDLVAFMMIGTPAPRTRVCRVSTKQRANLSVPGLLEMYPFAVSLKLQLIKLLIFAFLSSHLKLKSVSLNRRPEVKATRDFIKALKRAQGEVR